MRERFAWCLILGMAACEPEADGVGRACRADAQCAPLICGAELSRPPADLATLPLACAELSGQRAGTACERAADCDHGVCLLAGACAVPCRDTRDCGADQRCQAAYARVSQTSLASLSACINQIDLPADAQIRSQTLDAAVSGSLDRLALPEAQPRTLYVLEHLADMTWPIPSSLSRCRAPLCAVGLWASGVEAEVLFERDQLSASPEGPKNPIAQGHHVNPLTVWVPNSLRVAAEARAYELEVESSQPGAVRVTTLARPTTGLQLDLNLYYVGAADLLPEGARGPEVLQLALDEVDRIFEPTGIFIGDVRQVLVPGALPARGSDAAQGEVSAGFARLVTQYQVLPELPELLRLSAGAANSAIDVFFVADIATAGGADVGGISAGTPLAFGMHGGPGSGIVIAADMFVTQNRAAQLGRTLAHELGHALGLFHTTETNGLVFDPLDDTSSCPITQDRDHSGTLDATECAAYSGDNLMFPTSDAGDHLTEEQGEVLRHALILR